MQARIELMKNWLQSRDRRERIVLLCLSIAFTYFVWKFLIGNKLKHDLTTMNENIATAQTTIDGIKLQRQSVLNIVQQGSYTEKLHQQSFLSSKSQNFKQQLTQMIATVVSPRTLPSVTADILNQQQGITLIELKDLPPSPWMPADLLGLSLPPEAKELYKFSLLMEFHSDYFNTINYLARLEKLPWHLYWENLTYKVTNYPMADVSIQFYVLSHQAG